jgi:hypothetical protein
VQARGGWLVGPRGPPSSLRSDSRLAAAQLGLELVDLLVPLTEERRVIDDFAAIELIRAFVDRLANRLEELLPRSVIAVGAPRQTEPDFS